MDGLLIVNGEVVRAQDMCHDGGPQPDSHVQQDDEDDAATSTDCSDVGDDLSEPENEDHKGGMIEMFRKTHAREEFASPFLFTQSPLQNKEHDYPPATCSKGKEKERERTATPEPRNQTHGMATDLLHFLIGSHFQAAERKHPSRYSPYAAMGEHGVRGIHGPPTDHDDFGDIPTRWTRRHDMFSSRLMPFKARSRSRRPLPEFVTGPSRITLDDLWWGEN